MLQLVRPAPTLSSPNIHAAHSGCHQAQFHLCPRVRDGSCLAPVALFLTDSLWCLLIVQEQCLSYDKGVCCLRGKAVRAQAAGFPLMLILSPLGSGVSLSEGAELMCSLAATISRLFHFLLIRVFLRKPRGSRMLFPLHKLLFSKLPRPYSAENRLPAWV